MAQIEPVEFLWVNGETKWGVNLEVYGTYFGLDTLKAEITDIDDNLLFTSILNAKTLEEVAEKLSLTLKTMDNTKELLTEIMEADAKDGLYEQEQRMYSEKEVLKMLLIKHDGLAPEYVLQQYKKK